MNKPKRILNISKDSLQITLPDSRYYLRNGKYYPSITYVLSYFPKGKHFEDWLRKVGFASEFLVKKAAEEGTKVHDLIEDYLNDKTLTFLDENKRAKYDVDVWLMFLKFVEFWETYKPELLETEVHLFSDELKVAGTCDLICKIGGKIWLIDFKTSNHIHTIYELQTAIYGKCYEECFGIRPDKFGVLWLKSSKRKLNKEKMCGKGWEIIQSERSFEENLKLFNATKMLFDVENPTPTPYDMNFLGVVSKNN